MISTNRHTTPHTTGPTAGGAPARITAAAVLAGAALFTLAAPQATADTGPAVPPALTAGSLTAAHDAAHDPATLDTLSRFFARDGAVARSAAAPRIQGGAVPVRSLSPDFVAGKRGAAVAVLDYLALTALSSDGQKASLWTVPKTAVPKAAGQEAAGGASGDWQVVNIATGDDEARYFAAGARRLPGGTVFREPQIDAWYVHKGARVLPLDEDAAAAVGEHGTTLAAYGDRVRAAYGDKLPGSGYAHSGKAGGYDRGTGPGAEPAPVPGAEPAFGPAPEPASGPAAREAAASAPADAAVPAASDAQGAAVSVTSAAAGTGAVLALALCGVSAVRRHRRRGEAPATGA